MAEGPNGPGDGTAAPPQPALPQPQQQPEAPPPPTAAGPPDPFGAPGDPNRHFDGQQWLVWNGMAWVPEGPPVARPSASTRRTWIVVVAVIVVGLVVGGAFLASRVVNAHKAIVIPSSLGGLQKATDPRVTNAAQQFRSQAVDSLRGITADVGAYGSPGEGQVALLVAARGSAAYDDFFNGVKAGAGDITAPSTIGNSHCVTGSPEQIAVCMRSDSGLTVAVFLTGSDTTKASSMVDEAWNLQ